MSTADRREPIRLVNSCLLLWALLLAGLAVPSLPTGDSWVFCAFGLAVVTAGLGVWGLRRGEWVRPLFAALYVLAVICVALGPIAGSDIWPAIGIVCITVLSVGAAILHRLGVPSGRP